MAKDYGDDGMSDLLDDMVEAARSHHIDVDDAYHEIYHLCDRLERHYRKLPPIGPDGRRYKHWEDD